MSKWGWMFWAVLVVALTAEDCFTSWERVEIKRIEIGCRP